MSSELYEAVLARFNPTDAGINLGESLPLKDQDFIFSMNCNGYFLPSDESERTEWKYWLGTTEPLLEEFKAQRVSFYGPNGYGAVFWENLDGRARENQPIFAKALNQPSVTSVIRKYRELDENQAARIAFLLGGIVRHLASEYGAEAKSHIQDITRAVDYAAKMVRIGEEKSGEAIASAMVMYIISGGSLEEDKSFTGDIFRMSQAIGEDPAEPLSTRDLGRSQVARLMRFRQMVRREEGQPFPISAVMEYDHVFEGFPTVGAEFHFPLDVAEKNPDFWKRILLLNMSQYNRESHIQFSRTDQGVLEVRMNPADYATTIANWNLMRWLLPELNKTPFTITINRADKNFAWKSEYDKVLLGLLQTAGMFVYADAFKDIPSQDHEGDLDWGQIYLGQTVTLNEGKYNFDGNWSGGRGQYGQLGIYAGFGERTFANYAYYLSMALADPNIFQSIENTPRIRNLKEAIQLGHDTRETFFKSMRNYIASNDRLRQVHLAGQKIRRLLVA